jgi:hypothetical protein
VTEEKKFVADPEAWKIVDGKLYLNLDKDVQAEWGKDVSGNVRKADGLGDQSPALHDASAPLLPALTPPNRYEEGR